MFFFKSSFSFKEFCSYLLKLSLTIFNSLFLLCSSFILLLSSMSFASEPWFPILMLTIASSCSLIRSLRMLLVSAVLFSYSYKSIILSSNCLLAASVALALPNYFYKVIFYWLRVSSFEENFSITLSNSLILDLYISVCEIILWHYECAFFNCDSSSFNALDSFMLTMYFSWNYAALWSALWVLSRSFSNSAFNRADWAFSCFTIPDRDSKFLCKPKMVAFLF